MASVLSLALAVLAAPTPDASVVLQHFQACASRTGASATVILPAQAEILLPADAIAPGDEVAVLSPSGTCAGAAVWTGDAVALTVWGDDPFTPEIDGLSPGDPLTFAVYDVSNGVRHEAVGVRLQEAFGAEEAYASDALFVAGEAPATAEEAAPDPQAATLGAAYPNPAQSRVSIPFTLAEAGEVQLEVFDALGRLVARPVAERRDSGRHVIPIGVTDLAPGVYVVRLQAGDVVQQQPLTVAR